MKLKDLVKHLDLSQTTVSRALAGYDDVSEATRERVVAAARELGYAPSLNARRLESGRAEAIGLVMPIDPDGHAYPFFLEMIAGIGERLAEERLDLTLVTAREGAEELEAYNVWWRAAGSTAQSWRGRAERTCGFPISWIGGFRSWRTDAQTRFAPILFSTWTAPTASRSPASA